jgi:DNA-binding HxlR family transcriptional regulator
MDIAVAHLERAAARVADRWSLLVVAHLLAGPQTFSELTDALATVGPGATIAPNVLTARLRALERDGLVVATPYSRRPLRVRYGLTEAGRELGDALAVLADWGARRGGVEPDRHHRTCGTAVELRAWCPTCERVVDGEVDDLVWA